MKRNAASIDQAEVAHFSSHAAEWWDPKGAMAPLHRLNPARLTYIRDQALLSFGKTLKGASILDIGCGGGLLCEPMARMGGSVTGIDASKEAIAVAKRHAAQSGVNVSYLTSSAEEFSMHNQKFDLITALEIVEHVADLSSFLKAAAKMLNPNGILILSTVNRTPKSFLLGIVAAEYILKWVPRGTHDWRKFIRPSELSKDLRKAGLTIEDMTGVIYNPLNNDFSLRKNDVGMNYMLTAKKTD